MTERETKSRALPRAPRLAPGRHGAPGLSGGR